MIEKFRYFFANYGFVFYIVIISFFSEIQIYAQNFSSVASDYSIINPIKIKLSEIYNYDPIKNIFILDFKKQPVRLDLPLVLSPKEYSQLVLKEGIESYFKNKVRAIGSNKKELEEIQKDLLPDLYVNSNFFSSIFGSNKLDVKPQGSIGVDLGFRYQKTDNPSFSPRNRRNFGFDFDQRINLSLIGNIGERLQITANYDTESTFDFQNLVKLEFNPPKTREISSYIPKDIQDKMDRVDNLITDSTNSIDKVRGKLNTLRDSASSLKSFSGAYQNRLNNFLNKNVTEDAILQNIDIGNINMPINSTLINGAQSLMGVKAQLKFGRTSITGVFAEQRSQSQSVVSQGGGTLQDFSIYALDYEADRHFFLAHYFRDNYNKFLKTYPFINSPIQITRIEVWITNRQAQTNNIRNLVALQDIGESNPANTRLAKLDDDFIDSNSLEFLPSNSSNKFNPEKIGSGSYIDSNIRDKATISQAFGQLNTVVQEGIDYAILESARKLDPSEYTFHPQLGYISLNQRLGNDEILGVSFQFTYRGEVFQVGEFANSGQVGTNSMTISIEKDDTDNLIIKLLKSSLTNVDQPIWNLMMKNIYNTSAFQLEKEDFRLNILYSDPSPINYLSSVDDEIWPQDLSNNVLLRTLGLDKLNIYNDPEPKGDGFFDFIPGITVDQKYGRIIFPTIEPFGETLFDLLSDEKQTFEEYENRDTYNLNQKKYVFWEMYSLTQAAALQSTEKNKFQLKGRYKTANSDGISIGAFNIPRGSVQVTAGGRLLREGVDYTVNYQIGRVKILDPGLKASNIPIKIAVENNTFFGQQNKRFSGFDLIHQLNNNTTIGGTLINLSENPLTQKANYGTEPVNNTMIGLNTNFSTEVPFLTKLVNYFPTIQTNEKSKISVRAEVASLLARNPRNTQLQGEANVYLDDFEGAQTNIDVKGSFAWRLASIPRQKNYDDDYGKDNIKSGYKRAKLAWYTIDPVFYSGQFRPDDISNDDISLNTTRRIFINEIFPEQDLIQGQSTVQNTLDLSFFPNEKGPYNDQEKSSFQQDVKSNWGGIMRAINSTNFEQANVEFIEFWLLDTFNEIDGENKDLGNLIFHLGNISEDILPDGRKQFENGLPGSETTSTKTTNWGRTPSSQSLLYAFNSVESDRNLQDVGLDGLNDEEEKIFYPNGPDNDPAGDNYQFFLQAQGGIIDRYKNYNGTDGNSPISFSDENRGSTTEPDTEDINRDQTMNTIDSYFEYKVPIRKGMNVGNHPFVTDVRENISVTLPNGRSITTRWIQFKVPIDKSYYLDTNFKDYYQNINGIEDLRSIRFMRIVLKDFEAPVIFRFGTLDLVRGDWRRYNKSLNENLIHSSYTTVDISTVNILENENRVPINYVLPPDIRREQINNNNTIVRQNEQSLSFRFCNLMPMDYRGVFKNVDVDLRQYKKLKMYIHAESIQGNNPLPGEGNFDELDRRLVAFLRIGTDYQDNYYQIEVPLKPTKFGENSSNRISAEDVWNPDSNSIDFPMELLSKIKSKYLNKNSLTQASFYDTEMNEVDEFTVISNLSGIKHYRVSVKGNPSLGSIRTMMIGVKNPSKTIGDNLCGEVWFNELRIAGIDNQGGWASIGSIDGNMANFLNFSGNTRYSSIGFGSIDQSPNQRTREELFQYDFTTAGDVAKLLPASFGIQIPINYSVGEVTISPEFDPFYQDIKLKDRMDASDSNEEKNKIKSQAIDYTKRKNISIVGVKKIGTVEEKKFYNIENFDFSYSYNEIYHHDYEIENQKNKNIRLQGNYGYNFQSLEISPFSKIKFLKNKKYLEWLRNINFNPLPSSFSFSADINRTLNSQQFRDVYMDIKTEKSLLALPILVQRNYLFDNTFNLQYNLTRSARVNFISSTSRIIRNRFNDQNQEYEETQNIWYNIFDQGDPNRHFQNLNLTYKLPFKYFKFLSFIDSDINYNGDFSWTRGSDILSQVENDLGQKLGIVNTIQNANTKTINASIQTNKLYEILRLKNQSKRSLNNNLSNPYDSISKKNRKNKFLKTTVDILNSFKRLRLSYSENNGKVIPGYLPSVGFLGSFDPNLAFTFGSQSDIRYEIAKRGMLTDFDGFNQPFSQVRNNQLSINGQLKFGKSFLVDLNAERDYSENITENFNVSGNMYIPFNRNIYGNYGTSTVMIRTAFRRSRRGGSDFSRFRQNRIIIANRLAKSRGIPISDNVNTFPSGYSKNQQDVIIASFYSAYTGIDPNNVSLNPIKNVPIPNWNIRYTGLMNNKSVRKLFNRFSISHGYRSSYTINQFQSNLDYNPSHFEQKNQYGDYLSEILFGNINLVEQFNPLIRLDVELKNSLKILTELKTDRALSLSLDNNILTETRGDEYIFGLGYRLKNIPFTTNIGGRRRTMKGDLNIKADLSYRDNITILRSLNVDNNQVTAGQTLWSIKVTADYMLSRNLTALFFYDHNFSKFAISTAFPQTSIRSGISIQYNFGN